MLFVAGKWRKPNVSNPSRFPREEDGDLEYERGAAQHRGSGDQQGTNPVLRTSDWVLEVFLLARYGNVLPYLVGRVIMIMTIVGRKRGCRKAWEAVSGVSG